MSNSSSGAASVDRALSILAAFEDGSPALGLADIAEKTGLYKSTILRLIASLEKANLLTRLPSGKYQLGSRLLLLGNLYQQSFRLGDFLQPEMEKLASATGESAAFYVREGGQKVCLHRVNATQQVVLRYIQTGHHASLDSGASGAILLAFTETDRPDLQHIRDFPLVASLAGRETGSAAIACPIFGSGQDFLGALVLAGPITRFGASDIDLLTAQLLSCAIRTSELIGANTNLLRSLCNKIPTSL